MLHARHLLKKHSSLTVVNDVSLDVSRGEIVSIVGPSGAGKSSLLHLLGGLDMPDAGSVEIEGISLFSLPLRKQARFRAAHLGFVFQAHHLLPEFSAVENAALPLWISGKSRRQGLAEAGEMLGRVGMSHRLDHKPAQLSGGEGQRVSIARALVARPSVVLADEPTGNLDTANAESVHDLFLRLRDELGQTFILVTHNEELARRTDRTLTMRDGKLVDTSENGQ